MRNSPPLCANCRSSSMMRRKPLHLIKETSISMRSAETISFFQLRVHLRLMDSAGKQGTLRNRGLRAVKVFCAFSCSNARVILLQKRKKLLCPLVNTERGKVSFLCGVLDGGHDLICQLDLRLDAAARFPVRSQDPSAPHRSNTAPALWQPPPCR